MLQPKLFKKNSPLHFIFLCAFRVFNCALFFFDTVQIDDTKTSATDGIKSSTTKNDVANEDILCHGHILNALADNIYKIFCLTKTSVDLWEALEFKYGFAENCLS